MSDRRVAKSGGGVRELDRRVPTEIHRSAVRVQDRHNVARPNDIPFKEPEESHVLQLVPSARVPEHIRTIARVPAPPFGAYGVVDFFRSPGFWSVPLEDCRDALEGRELPGELEAAQASHIVLEWSRGGQKGGAVVAL